MVANLTKLCSLIAGEKQATLLYLPKSMARMVSVAAVVCAVVIIMQAPWGDGLWGSKRIPAYYAHGLHGFFRPRRVS